MRSRIFTSEKRKRAQRIPLNYDPQTQKDKNDEGYTLTRDGLILIATGAIVIFHKTIFNLITNK